MSSLLCACEDGKRCADCERIERFDAARRNMAADRDRMAAEADRLFAEWLARNSLDDTEASPTAPADPTSPEPPLDSDTERA